METHPRDLFATLVHRRREARVRDERRADELRRIAREVVAELRARGSIEAAWLIGSLAWGAFDAHSDVDIVVRGVPVSELTGVAAELTRRLGDDVDVLRIEALAEPFRRRVLEKGIRLDEP